MNVLTKLSAIAVIGLSVLSSACSDSNSGVVIISGSDDSNGSVTPSEITPNSTLSDELREQIFKSTGQSYRELILPDSDDFGSIPQDPSNTISAPKIELGMMLFHDTGIATAGNSGEQKTWSCATCHHAAAGFKSGVPQGIGEGGFGFGLTGSNRRLSVMFDATADADAPNKPDLQPFTSPTILNSAYQDVMLWNGQFGNSGSGVNIDVPAEFLLTTGTPKEANALGLSGLETQAVAGLGVHRLKVDENTVLQSVEEYRRLFESAYADGSDNVKRDAAKAIAAYERTVLANRAPFQLWLRGDDSAMTDAELTGAMLFFGKADCSECHQGPALSSKTGATESAMFMSIGFADFDPENHGQVHGVITDADRNGRGGFTNDPSDRLKFKIPQLYNLKDTEVFGHGGTFSSIRAVIEYKNKAIPQTGVLPEFLDARFKPLNLTPDEVDSLQHFLTTGLYDPDLMRYQPSSVPSGECVVVNPLDSDISAFCP